MVSEERHNVFLFLPLSEDLHYLNLSELGLQPHGVTIKIYNLIASLLIEFAPEVIISEVRNYLP